MKEKITNIVKVALFVALCSVCAMVTIPFGPVPFTLQTFAFTLVLFCLEPNLAFSTTLLYLAVGALGAPVFSGMKGGIGSVIGPTGGFLIGYALSIFPLGKLKELVCLKVKKQTVKSVLLVIIGFAMTLVAYAFGCLQYSFVAGVGIEVAFFVAVVPFVMVDFIKIVLAYFSSRIVNRLL